MVEIGRGKSRAEDGDEFKHNPHIRKIKIKNQIKIKDFTLRLFKAFRISTFLPRSNPPLTPYLRMSLALNVLALSH